MASDASAGDGGGDCAARHARALLRACELDRPIADRCDAPTPAVEWARSGAMSLTGERDGPPGFAAGALASAAQGAGLALAALAPQRGFEALDAAALLGERAALFGFTRRGRASCGGSARLLEGADGRLALNLPRDDDWRMLEAWLEESLPAPATARDWTSLSQAVARRTTEELVARGREIGLAVAPARETLASPSAPFECTLANTTGDPRRPHPVRPLRVLDLSTLWAGPLAGGLLAQAGCDVVKIETTTRPDGARAGAGAFFDLLNADKRGAALDLRDDADRRWLRAAMEGADVVIESARPRAWRQLGFDAEAWVRGRAGRIWASITGYGRACEWIAFGDDAAVAAGLAFEPPARGDPSTRPTARFCADAVADPLTGLYAAVAILSLAAGGRGGLVALSLADVAAHAARADDPADASPAAAGRWTAPLVERTGRHGVVDGSRVEPVAAPRARAPRGVGPRLAPPAPGMLDAWTRPC